MDVEYFVLILLGIIIFFLLVLLRRKPQVRNKVTEKKQPCPLCGSLLIKSEKVKSIVFPGKPDQLMHIFGCPYCYVKKIHERVCPVCKKRLKDKEYVIARVFKKPGKTHVHVLGCTSCRMG